MIWVGGDYETVGQFVKEARTRGCCRRVPYWPAWARPGETRVFLAHRDRHVRTDRGSIFGYYTLGGVGIVFDSDRHERYRKLVEQLRAAPEDRKTLEKMVDLWREAGVDALPVVMPDAPPYDDALLEFVLDFLIDCDGEGSGPSGYGICADQASLEAERGCGFRQPGGVYFVDELAQAVDWLFCELLKETIEGALAGDSSASTDAERKRRRRQVVARLRHEASGDRTGGLWSGIPQFEEALERAHARISWPLFVFAQPYPSFTRLPQAAFRGLLQVDGDELLMRIAAAGPGHVVQLPYYHPAPGKKKTKSELVTDLAEGCQASKAFVSGFLGSVAEEIVGELRTGRPVTLTGVGTLRVKRSRGEQTIAFTPSRTLERRVTSARDRRATRRA